MPNIFDGINKLEDSSVVDFIAMLEATTMGNVMKGYGTTVANKGAKFLNGVGNIFGKKLDITVVEEKRIDDYIEERRKIHYKNDRSLLDLKLKKLLAEKNNLTEYCTDDAISISVINSAAKEMKIDDNILVSQKAEGVYKRYFEKLISNLQKQLSSQSVENIQKVENAIDKELDNISDLDKEELRNSLNINQLSGKEITAILRKTSSPAIIMGVLSASGFGAYMALTTIIHAVFTTILGITLPFAVYTSATTALSVFLGPVGLIFVAGTAIWQLNKGNRKLKNEVFNQIIFSAVNAFEGRFTVQENKLPSYENDPYILEQIEKMEKEYKEILAENQFLSSRINSLESDAIEAKSCIARYKDIINYNTSTKANVENELIKLKNDKLRILNEVMYREEQLASLKSQYNEVGEEKQNEINTLTEKLNHIKEQLNDTNNKIFKKKNYINKLKEDINSKDSEIARLEKETKDLEAENENLKAKLEVKNSKQNILEDKKRKEIQEKWTTSFKKFNFTSKAIRSVLAFGKKEIWEIEKALFELHNSNDPKSYSRGKIKDNNEEYEHLGLNLPNGHPTRILYKILKNSPKKVEIVLIYKHNQKIYQ